MVRQWTRAHDAVLAEKCEGITTFVEDEHLGLSFYDEEGDEGWGPPMVQVPHYQADISATIRAAEAWRKQGDGRYWQHGVDQDGNDWGEVGQYPQSLRVLGPAALAWALCEAVKDD